MVNEVASTSRRGHTLNLPTTHIALPKIFPSSLNGH